MKSPWFWLGLLLVVGLLFWLWHRHRKLLVVSAPQSIGTPLAVRPAGPAPTSIFSTLAIDSKTAAGVFGGASTIFSSLEGS
jgi:hypothetical protein